MSETRSEPPAGAWLAVAVLAGGLFVAVVSTTVVSVALPSIGRQLHADSAELESVVDSYVLVYASLLVAGGVLGDRRGRKGLFMIGVAVFGGGWDFAFVGAGIGLCLTPMTAVAVAAVAASRAGMASAVHNALRQLGQVLGVAVLGALVYSRLPAGQIGGRFDIRRQSLFVGGLHRAIWVSGIALLASVVLAAFCPQVVRR